MKAIVQSGYGSPEVYALGEVPMPTIGDDEVLVRVRAASLHPDVWHVMEGVPYVLRFFGSGLMRPKHVIPGTDMAGVVEAVGKDVTSFQPGDEVFGETVRGHQWKNGGAFAECVAVLASALAKKPAGVSFEEAAAMPTTGCFALQFVRQEGQVRAGQRVLINGAAGGTGALSVQIAKAFGATVTAVDHTRKLDLLRTIGADHVIDFTVQDFTEGTERYDVIIDIPGNHSFSKIRRVLMPVGRYVFVGHDDFGRAKTRALGSVPRAFGLMALSLFSKQLTGLSGATPAPDRLAVLTDLLAAGKIRPVIDRTFPLEQAANAMRYLQTGEARGRVVLTV